MTDRATCETERSDINSFQQPYADAGHDVESLFSKGGYKCSRCGAYLIDLSEDLVYGPMRKCVEISPDPHLPKDEV